MIGYVYLTKNKINGRPYVGSHAKPFFDKKYLGSGDTIRKAIKKYGRENFSCRILFRANSQDEMLSVETYFIRKVLKKYGSFAYNIALDGLSPMKGRKHTEAFKKARSERFSGNRNNMYGISQKGEKNPMFGRKQSEETRKKISEKLKGNVNALNR